MQQSFRVFVVGTLLMLGFVSSYAGNALAVWKHNPDAQSVIGWNGDSLNSNTLSSFLAGAVGQVTTWPDQVGGNNAQQAFIRTANLSTTPDANPSVAGAMVNPVNEGTSTAQTAPSVLLTINGKEGTTTLAKGESYTVAWGSSNVSSCSDSTYTADGKVYAWNIGINGSWSYPTTFSGNSFGYKVDCIGTNGQKVSKSVTISVPVAAARTYLDVKPFSIFPSPQSILPSGVTYTDTIPDTLDLADRAAYFLHSEASTAIASLKYVPAHAIFGGLVAGEDSSSQGQGTFQSTWCKNIFPCLWPDAGDWGLEMIAMAKAREMTPYDRSDSAGTLSTQYKMLTNLFDVSASQYVEAYTGAGALKPAQLGKDIYPDETAPQVPITSATFAMEALLAYLKEQPGNSLLQAGIQGFVQMHKDLLNTAVSGGGTFSYYFDRPALSNPATEQGYTYIYPVFIQGRAVYGLLSVFKETGNSIALTTARSLMDFLQRWTAPYNGKPLLPPASSDGSFTDHIYSQEQGIHALIADAEVRRAAGDTSGASQELTQANNMYQYIIRATLAGVAGNFGESGTSGEMIRIAIKLTDLGVGSYFDQAEYWVRNQLSESQLGVNSSIGWNSAIGGMFWSDATHPFSIPTNNKNFRYNVDGSANAIVAMSDVYNHIVTYKGATALVNFLLNGTSRYVTVRSDLPYRGQIEAQTAPDMGNITALAIRIPNWAERAYVSVTARDANGVESVVAADTEAGWKFVGSYAYIYSIKPNVAYTVRFPIKVYTTNVYQLRSSDTFWFESSVAAGNEQITKYTVTLRGYDIVSATPVPSYSGVALYQRQALAALPATNVAPPTKTVQRFIYNGTPTSIPAMLPPPVQSSTSLTINNQTGTIHVAPGSPYTIAWGSSNVTSCAASSFTADGATYPWKISANSNLSFATTLSASTFTYSLSCTGVDGQQLSKTVTITSK